MTTATAGPAVRPPATLRDPSASRGRVRGVVALLGPAFVAAVAYVDPGNFATNIGAGSAYGYRLIWVIVVANGAAMLIQTLSAKVGVATGRDLASVCRTEFPRPVVLVLWAQAELVAMATDLAEVMAGLLRRQLPLLLRRAITIAPALLVLGLGADPTRTLVLSQVLLSLGIPFALVPLVLVTRRRALMGELVNRRCTTGAAALVAVGIVAINGWLSRPSAEPGGDRAACRGRRCRRPPIRCRTHVRPTVRRHSARARRRPWADPVRHRCC